MKNPYTCNKSEGVGNAASQLAPFNSVLRKIVRYARNGQWNPDATDPSTIGWEGVLNNRGVDRAFFSEGKESCETPGDYGWPGTQPNFCEYFDIKGFGQSNEKVKRQFWYDEMNKD